MGWEGIGDLIGTLAKWWTPEQIKARALDKIKRLENEKKQILKQNCTAANIKRMSVIQSSLNRLKNYIENH